MRRRLLLMMLLLLSVVVSRAATEIDGICSYGYKSITSATVPNSATSIGADIQSDVTSLYLTNADFSESTPIDNHLSGYGSNMSTDGTTYYGLQEVTGWTAVVVTGINSNPNYPNSAMGGAVFAYGSKWQMKGNHAAPPDTGPNERTGNCLGYFAVWGTESYYYQEVTLPAGKYTLTIPIYNRSGTQGNTSNCGFFADDEGASYTVAVNPTVGSWTNQTVTFTLTEQTTGQIRLGYKSAGNGSPYNPMLFIDCVKLEYTDLLADMEAGIYTEINGIYYNLNSNSKTATVTSGTNKYSGSVTIPATVSYNDIDFSVTSIGGGAFSYCSGLTSVTIPNSVTNIENFAFASCSGLTSIIVDTDNTKYDSRNSCNAVIESATNTLVVGCKNTIIPYSVTCIGVFAFQGCSGLTSISIPSNVTSIERGSFDCCSGLTSVNIPNCITTIGDYAFYGCSTLKDFYCYADELPQTDLYAFPSSNIANATLHVPAASVATYQTTEPWSGFKEVVAIDELQRYLDSLTDTEDCFADGVYCREFKNGDWQALYIPFEMNFSDWSDKFDVARVSGSLLSSTVEGLYSGLDGNVLLAEMVESGKVEANYPYLIRAKSKYGATLTVSVTGNVNMTSGTTAFASASIIGNYEKMYKMNTYKRYRLQGGSLSIPNSDNEMLPPFRWYVRGPENQASRLSIEINGEEVTGIESVSPMDRRDAPQVYDLLGRKVDDGQQLKGGLYIINNKKYVVK